MLSPLASLRARAYGRKAEVPSLTEQPLLTIDNPWTLLRSWPKKLKANHTSAGRLADKSQLEACMLDPELAPAAVLKTELTVHMHYPLGPVAQQHPSSYPLRPPLFKMHSAT